MRLGEGCTEPAKASSDQQIQAIKGIVSEIFFLKKRGNKWWWKEKWAMA